MQKRPTQLVRLSLLGLSLLVAPVLQAKITEHSAAKYYAVHGDSIKTLRRELSQKGPSDAQGHRYDGVTQWQVQWQLQLREFPHKCQLANVNVTSNITITMPRWNPPPQASIALQNRWNTYLRRLQEHENKHAQHGLTAAREINKKLLTLKPASSCGALQKHAQKLSAVIINTAKQKDIDFDNITDHGRTQGAHFP